MRIKHKAHEIFHKMDDHERMQEESAGQRIKEVMDRKKARDRLAQTDRNSTKKSVDNAIQRIKHKAKYVLEEQ